MVSDGLLLGSPQDMEQDGFHRGGWKLFRKWTPALMVVEARYQAVPGACAPE